MVVDVTMVVDNQKNVEVGVRMKAAREALGLTQDGFARAVGGSKRGIQENEARNRVPGGEIIAGMVRLGINANWLLTGEGPMLLADLSAPAPTGPMPAINVDCLEALIEGTLRIAPNAPPAAIAAQIASIYKGFLEKGLITPEGKQGTGNLSAAA